MLIAALVLDHESRGRLRDAVRSVATIRFADSLAGLEALVAHEPVVAVIVESRQLADDRMSAAVRAIKRGYPRLPVIAYVTPCAAGCRDAFGLARSGADALLVRGEDDVGAAIRGVLLGAEGKSAAAAALAYLRPRLPAAAVPFVEHCLRAAASSSGVIGAAEALGVHRKTLVNRMAAAGMPPPRAVLSWCRLVIAARLLEEPGRSVEQAALALDFGSGAALRNMFRRYTGLKPSEVRERGGMSCVLDLFAKAIRRRSGVTGASMPRATKRSPGAAHERRLGGGDTRTRARSGDMISPIVAAPGRASNF